MSILSWLNPANWFASKPRRPARKQRYGQIAAGTYGPVTGTTSTLDSTTDWNTEVMQARDLARGRCVPAYYNNPYYRGLVRNRRNRTVGAELRFRASIRGNEIPGVTPEIAAGLNRKINALYRQWSDSGECDASGMRRPIGALQGAAMIDAFGPRGGVLVRVVERPKNKTIPIGIELISVTRMKRPSNTNLNNTNEAGIEYADDRHSVVTGYWVTVQRGFSRTEEFQFLPASECVLFQPEELVGVEASLPRDVAISKSLHRLTRFNDAILEAAETLARQPITVTPPEGGDPDSFAEQFADSSETNSEGTTDWVRNYGGVEAYVTGAGEKIERHAAELPAPDLPGFIANQLRAVAAGADMSYARVAKVPDGSYAAGRAMEQDDRPQIDIDRALLIAQVGGFVWCKVLDALWSFDIVSMPGYEDFAQLYQRYSVTPPAQEHLNPVDQINAIRSRMEAGLLSPQDASEAFGDDYEDVLAEQADAYLMRRAVEKVKGLPPMALEPYTQTGQVMDGSTQSQPPAPTPEPQRNNGHARAIP